MGLDTGDPLFAAFHASAWRVADTAYWKEHYLKLGSASGPEASEYIKDIAEYLLARKKGAALLVATLGHIRIEEDPPASPSH